jgi:hypothetical protein
MAGAGTARLTAALAGAVVSWDQVASYRSLTGGTFNAVHLVGLADGTRLVVKIPPGWAARWPACTITGTRFGYPSRAVGPLRNSWREAFLDMVNAVLADAGRFAVALPRPAAGIQEWFTAQAAVLDEVTTPVLVYFDLWDGNILGRVFRPLTEAFDDGAPPQ